MLFQRLLHNLVRKYSMHVLVGLKVVKFKYTKSKEILRIRIIIKYPKTVATTPQILTKDTEDMTTALTKYTLYYWTQNTALLSAPNCIQGKKTFCVHLSSFAASVV